MVNKVFLIGNLGADPEIRERKNGEPLLTFRMAVNSPRRFEEEDGSVAYRNEPDWIPVVVFGNQVQLQAKYLQKGTLIHLEGRLRFRQYQNADGETRTSHEVVAQRIEWIAGTRIEESDESEATA